MILCGDYVCSPSCCCMLAEGILPCPIKCHHWAPGNFQKGQRPQGYQEVVQQPRSSEAEFEVCTVSNNWLLQLFSLYSLCLYIQVCAHLGITDYVWQDKRSAIALTVDSMGDQFRSATRAGWLSYIRNNYQSKSNRWTSRWSVMEKALWSMRRMLELEQLLLLLIRLISAMKIHLNHNFQFWNNAYNSTNNSYNSKIISIIVFKKW